MKYNFRPLFGICRGFACDVGACKFVASGQVQLTNHIKHTHGKNDDEDDSSALSSDEADAVEEFKKSDAAATEIGLNRKSTVIAKLRTF